MMAPIRHKATDTLEKRLKMPRSVSTSLGLKYLVTEENLSILLFTTTLRSEKVLDGNMISRG